MTNEKTTISKILNIGVNKGKPRLWIEGNYLLDNGFQQGGRYILNEGKLELASENSDQKTRKISGKNGNPIVDISGKNVEKLCGVLSGKILLTGNGKGTILISAIGG